MSVKCACVYIYIYTIIYINIVQPVGIWSMNSKKVFVFNKFNLPEPTNVFKPRSLYFVGVICQRVLKKEDKLPIQPEFRI